ncbi:MAG: polysaccharide deacetylase [Oscillospiraceae bacterium]|nr:polysaccharide deacetylase [Oscillospiraceae bacterium]
MKITYQNKKKRILLELLSISIGIFGVCLFFIGGGFSSMLPASVEVTETTTTVTTTAPTTTTTTLPAPTTSTTAAANHDSVKNESVHIDNVAPRRRVYLTFDDGPSKLTKDFLAVLKKHKVHGTFFVIDTKYDHELDNIFRSGHVIGLHSASHDYKDIYESTKSFWKDMDKIADIVKENTGQDAEIIRFPGGGSNTVSRKYSEGIMQRLVAQSEKRGLVYFDWNCDSGDTWFENGKPFSEKKILKNIKESVEKREDDIILLMHDRYDMTNTLEALPKIIKYFKKQGFVFDVLTKDTPPVRHKVVN